MLQKFRNYYHTAIADLRFQGLEVLCWRVIVKVLSPVVRLDLQILFQRDLLAEIEPRKPDLEVSLEQAGEADLDAMLDLQMRMLEPDDAASLPDELELQYAQMARARAQAYVSCLRQFHAGEECYVARVDGVIAHCNWIRYHGCGRVDGRPVTLETGEVYTTDAFTGEAFRGRGLHELVLSYMLEQARVRGNHRAYTITDMMKAGSRRGVKRLAWERRGVILYVTPRAMGRTWLFRLSGDLEPIFSQARTSVAQV